MDQKSFVSKNRLEFFRIRKFKNKDNRVAIVVLKNIKKG